VPEDEVDAWVAELLALNGVQANALQVGQSLVLPPIGGAQASGSTGSTGPTAPANTGGPTGSTAPTGATGPAGTTGATNPTATHTSGPSATAVPTNTVAVAATATSTVAATSTTGPTASPTTQPTATATLSPTPGPASFNIIESTVSPGGTVHWEASGFTPNDTLTIYSCYVQLNFCDSTTTTTGSTGAFSDSGVVPTDAPKGTYTVQLTDGHGKTASDSFTVQ
jgi:hypothetical protein